MLARQFFACLDISRWVWARAREITRLSWKSLHLLSFVLNITNLCKLWQIYSKFIIIIGIRSLILVLAMTVITSVLQKSISIFWRSISNLPKIIKNIQIQHLNQCNSDHYPFFSTNDLLGRNFKLFLQQGNFLENLIPALNKETKNKALMLKIDASCYFHILPPDVYLQGFPYWGGWWGSSPTSRKFANPPPPHLEKLITPPLVDYPYQKLSPPHSIIIFMLKSIKKFIFNCSHCSCTILILTLYSLYTKVMLIWF